MDQNLQFIITVGTVIGVFIWLRYDINHIRQDLNNLKQDVRLLDAKIDRVNENYASVRETLGWVRGRLSEPLEPPKQE